MKRVKIKGDFLKKSPLNGYLYHQERTLKALLSNEIVFNTYPTGAGKTTASLLYLKENPSVNALFIAPTNELLKQHEEDIKEFRRKNFLPHHVVRIDAAVLERLRRGRRKGAVLHEILENPQAYMEELVLDYDSKLGVRPYVIVINPDLFYMCLYRLYNRLDETNLHESILKEFDYIVIDEFHYYNSKQIVNFLVFILLSKGIGRLENLRKLCILTATPNKLVEKYLQRANVRYEFISPENEPPESENYDRIQTLSSLDLIIFNEDIEEKVEKVLEQYGLDDNKDGVIIAGSLIKINRIKSKIKDYRKIGIITGAVTSQERKNAIKYPLILATPTVDIGFNFSKYKKERQNIDYVITEANSSDEFLQRIGRAGRILGKGEKNVESTAVVFVKNSDFKSLDDGNIYSRKELKQIVLNSMKEKSLFEKYINYYSILEMCIPFSKDYHRALNSAKAEIKSILDNIIEVFLPKNRINITSLFKKVHNQMTSREFLNIYKKDKDITKLNEQKLIKFLNYNKEEFGFCEDIKEDENDESDLNEIKKYYEERIINFLEEENAIYECLTAFRGQAYNYEVLIYDPKNIFGNESKVLIYDVFHLIRYYNVSWYKSIGDLEKCYSVKVKDYEDIIDLKNIKIYAEVHSIREENLKISLEYLFYGDSKEFEDDFLNKIKVVKGVLIKAARKEKRDTIIEALPQEIAELFKEKYLLFYTIEDDYRDKRILNKTGIIPFNLDVKFSKGGTKTYKIVIGTNSFFIDAEMINIRNSNIALKEEFFIV